MFAIAILLGWYEFVLILGQTPLLSVRIEMFKRVSLTFLKFIAGFFVLILAFALSFYILFKKDVKENDAVLFTNPWTSMLKTFVMFVGEFEYSYLRFDKLLHPPKKAMLIGRILDIVRSGRGPGFVS